MRKEKPAIRNSAATKKKKKKKLLDIRLDAAAFLGAGLGQEPRLRARRRADDAERQGARADPARNSDLFAAAGAARRRAVDRRHGGQPIRARRRWRSASRWSHWRSGSTRIVTGWARTEARCVCSASRSFICSFCSACWWSSAARVCSRDGAYEGRRDRFPSALRRPVDAEPVAQSQAAQSRDRARGRLPRRCCSTSSRSSRSVPACFAPNPEARRCSRNMPERAIEGSP